MRLSLDMAAGVQLRDVVTANQDSALRALGTVAQRSCVDPVISIAKTCGSPCQDVLGVARYHLASRG